jgi:hypothetical protein
MNGITTIEIPEIEGLEEVFAKNTVSCDDSGNDVNHV